jgi:hypothetical protein
VIYADRIIANVSISKTCRIALDRLEWLQWSVPEEKQQSSGSETYIVISIKYAKMDPVRENTGKETLMPNSEMLPCDELRNRQTIEVSPEFESVSRRNASRVLFQKNHSIFCSIEPVATETRWMNVNNVIVIVEKSEWIGIETIEMKHSALYQLQNSNNTGNSDLAASVW